MSEVRAFERNHPEVDVVWRQIGTLGRDDRWLTEGTKGSHPVMVFLQDGQVLKRVNWTSSGELEEDFRDLKKRVYLQASHSSEFSCVKGRHPRLRYGDAPVHARVPSTTLARRRPAVSDLAPTSSQIRQARELTRILSSIRNLAAVRHNPKTGEIDLIEELDSLLPPLRADDFRVALRAALDGEMPGVSIDPAPDSGPEDKMVVTYFGGTKDSRFGQVMFEADRLLKNLSVGYDNLSCDRVVSHVPGFKTELARLAEVQGGSWLSVWHRIWLVPKALGFLTDRLVHE